MKRMSCVDEKDFQILHASSIPLLPACKFDLRERKWEDKPEKRRVRELGCNKFVKYSFKSLKSKGRKLSRIWNNNGLFNIDSIFEEQHQWQQEQEHCSIIYISSSENPKSDLGTEGIGPFALGLRQAPFRLLALGDPQGP